MGLVEQWQRIEASLPQDSADARLELTISDEARSDRAAALLAPLNPGRFGKRFRFYTARRGAGPAPGLVGRLLALLDEERIEGTLEAWPKGRRFPRPRRVRLRVGTPLTFETLTADRGSAQEIAARLRQAVLDLDA